VNHPFCDRSLPRRSEPAARLRAARQARRRDHDAGTEDRLASAALELINSSSITALFVVEDGRPVGIIHIHNLLRAGVA
jgi:high-affinity K+ transport system ATPase subunit B